MVNMKINNFRRMILWGLTCAGLYTIFFCAALSSAVFRGTWDAQIAVAFISAPTSAWILGAIHPLLGMIGTPGSSHRQIAEWITIYIAGTFQYFALGFLINMLLDHKSGTNHD